MRSTCCHRGPWKDTSLSDAALPGRETEREGTASMYRRCRALLGNMSGATDTEMGQAAGVEFPACSLELLLWKEAKGNGTRWRGRWAGKCHQLNICSKVT